MRAGRQADSARRRQRVITAISQATSNGTEISVAGIARAAGVDRTFLYRHRDLLEKIHALEAAPPAAGQAAGPAVTRASLQADLLAAHERAARLNAQVRQLEKRLSEALGEQAWRESGLGAPPDIDALNHKISQARTAGRRPADPAQRTRRRARRRPRRQPRAHDPHQPRTKKLTKRRHATCTTPVADATIVNNSL